MVIMVGAVLAFHRGALLHVTRVRREKMLCVPTEESRQGILALQAGCGAPAKENAQYICGP